MLASAWLAAGCDEPRAVAPPVDAPPALDAAIDAPPPPDASAGCVDGPRAGQTLRAALDQRGRWTAAWQLDERGGAIVDGIAGLALAARGAPTFAAPGATAGDCAVALTGADDGFGAATPATFDVGDSGSFAIVLTVAVDGAGLLASKRATAGPGYELAVAAATGHLEATLDDGVRTVTVALPIDVRDHAFHDVVLVIDRRARRARLVSDLGRSPETSIAGLGSLASSASFALGAAGARAGAAQRLAFVAVAADGAALPVAEVDGALLALRLVTDRAAPIVRPPAALPWAPPWPITRREQGRFTIDVDPRSLRLPTTADVWLSPTGDDGAAGTAAAPRRSLAAALAAMTAPTTIHLAAGTYDAAAGWSGVSPPHDVNVIAEGGRAHLTSATVGLVWQPVAPGSYDAAVAAAPYAVVDPDRPDGDGDPWLTPRGSVAEVVAEAGTWTHAAGRVTVHLRAGQSAPARLRVLPTATLNGQVDGPDRSVYLEGLDFDGGYRALLVQRARRVVIVDCGFRFGAAEGLSVNQTEEALVFGAIAEANSGDGLGYATTAHVLEVDCVGRDNGRDGTNLDNGSTVHSGGTVVRVGGSYRDNLGPNVADVQGARSWALGTVAGGTRATSSSQRVNFVVDGEMWLREASATDDSTAQTSDLATATAASALHVHDTAYATTRGAGTIDGAIE